MRSSKLSGHSGILEPKMGKNRYALENNFELHHKYVKIHLKESYGLVNVCFDQNLSQGIFSENPIL